MLPSPSGFLAEAISLYKILAWTDNPDFKDQTWRKKVFRIKNRKSEHHHCILQIRISLGIKFHLKMTTFNFLDQISPNRVFLIWTEKVNSAIEFWIFELFWVPNFSFNWQF